MSNGTSTLYRFFDIDKRLLYVGISLRPWQRFLEHRSLKVWWQDAESIRLEHFATRKEAAKAELHAIKTEQPLFNVQGRQLSGPWDVDFEVLIRAEPRLRPLIQRALAERYCPWERNLGRGDEIRAEASNFLGPKRGRPAYLTEHAGGARSIKESLEPFLAGWEAELERGAIVSTVELMLRDPYTLGWFGAMADWFLRRSCGHEHFRGEWEATDEEFDEIMTPWWVER